MLNIYNKSSVKKGFTLAETLIALVIIGVVAALTIPNMVVRYQKEETANRLKKVYSTLQQAMNEAVADNGSVISWEFEDSKTKEFVDKYFLPYLSVSKTCGYTYTGDCAFKAAYLNTPNSQILYKDIYGFDYYSIILNDGSTVAFVVVNNSGCNVIVDINGMKKPNIFGRDVFMFIIYPNFGGQKINNQNKLLPQGGFGGTKESRLTGTGTSACNKSSKGFYCAAVIMFDSWQIKDDYPW